MLFQDGHHPWDGQNYNLFYHVQIRLSKILIGHDSYQNSKPDMNLALINSCRKEIWLSNIITEHLTQEYFNLFRNVISKKTSYCIDINSEIIREHLDGGLFALRQDLISFKQIKMR